jgi:ribosomal protein S18 acetylase RimI-like enzyme
MSRPTPTIRLRRPSDLPECASLLARVYAKDHYPVQGVSNAIEFLSSPATLAAWVAVQPQPTSPSLSPNDNDNDSNTSPTNSPQDIQHQPEILAHVALSAPSPSDPAVALWQSQNQPEPVAVLERLFVDPVARGQGLAEQLMKTASAEAERLGLRVVLFTLVKDQGAMRLYRRVGWREFGRGVFGFVDGERRKGEMEAVCFVDGASG